MDLLTISQELNKRFDAPLNEFYKRRIVVWYDEEGEFLNQIDELKLHNARVLRLTETNNFSMVDLAKRGIIRIYQDDFQKLDPTGRLETLFMEIPSQLSQTNTRYKPFTVLGDIDDDKLMELMNNLDDSKTVLFSYHSNDPNVGMSLTKNISKYKIFCADTGLFVTLAFWDKDYTENVIYQKLLNDKLSTNLGYVYENVIAQVLATSGNKLFYYTWQKDETHSYEIDFLLSRGAKLHPIEVKSSGYKTHKSLDVFCEKYSHIVDHRYLLYTKDLKRDGATMLVPVYLAMFL